MSMAHAGHPCLHYQSLRDLLLSVIRVSQYGRHQLIRVIRLHLPNLLLLIPFIWWCMTHQADLGGHQRGSFTSNQPWGQLEVALFSPLAGPADFRVFKVLFHRVV